MLVSYVFERLSFPPDFSGGFGAHDHKGHGCIVLGGPQIALDPFPGLITWCKYFRFIIGSVGKPVTITLTSISLYRV